MAENVRGAGNQSHYFRVNLSICQRKAKKGRSIWKKRRLLPSELGKVTDVPDRKAIHWHDSWPVIYAKGIFKAEQKCTRTLLETLTCSQGHLQRCWRDVLLPASQTLSVQPSRTSLGILPVSCSVCFPHPQVPAPENWGCMQHQHSAKASSWGHPRDQTEQPLLCSEQGKTSSTEEGTETDAELKIMARRRGNSSPANKD